MILNWLCCCSTAEMMTPRSVCSSFSERIHPPSRFSDSRSHSRELSDAECDLKLGRRSSRGSIGSNPSRLTRETTFQIDV